MLFLASVAPLLLAAVPVLAQDIQFDQAHNATPIYGTWSTGSKAVSTGPVRLLPSVAASLADAVWNAGVRKSGQYDLHLPSSYRAILLFVSHNDYLC